MSILETMVSVLCKAGLTAYFAESSGGVHCVNVDFGPVVYAPQNLRRYEILISGRYDTFGRDDYYSDDWVEGNGGFTAGMYAYTPDGERDMDAENSVLVYETDVSVLDPDVAVEALKCADAVQRMVHMISELERVGRLDEDRYTDA